MNMLMAKEYMKLVENGKSDGYVYKQLADSYYNMFNPYRKFAKWYAKAVETNQKFRNVLSLCTNVES
jgi:hypothetical protein